MRTFNDGLLISLSIPCSINEWRTTTTALPPTASLHLIIYIGRTSLPTPGHKRAPDRVGAVPSTSSCFFTGVSRTFFTAAGRFLNRGGCCRHAAYDGGDGDDGKEENSFSDRHWLQTHQGEADSIRHGFLCLPHSPCSINEWRTTTTALPPTAPLHLIIYIGRTTLPTLGHEKAPNRVGLGHLMKYERLNSTV